MLTTDTRPDFRSLLDAITLRDRSESAAIIFVQTGGPPVTVTRQSFVAAATSYAAALRLIGIGPGDVVVIAHTQNLESIYLFWGCLLLGAVPAMFPTLTEKLDPDIYMAGMAELVRLSGVAAVLTTDEFARSLREAVSAPVFGTSELELDQRLALDTIEPPDPEAIAFLQHSSGTTGLQKGVALSHTAVLNQVAAYSDALDLSRNDVIVSWLPLYHDMGLIAGFLLPLIQGVPLVLMSPFDWAQHPALLLRAIDEYKGTLCWQPNFAYNHCARRIRQRDSEGLSLSSMRLFINCSEPVRSDSHDLFRERFAVNGIRSEMLGVSYAMAENVFAVTQTPPGQPARLDIIDSDTLQREGIALAVSPDHPSAEVRVSCGPAIAGTAVVVLDEQGERLPERTVGELAIRSNCQLTEYYRRPDLNPFTVDGWFCTGDVGYLAGTDVFVIGRNKDLIINAGKNVYPQDIEVIAGSVAGVHAGRVAAFGVPDEREGTELIVIVAEARWDGVEEERALVRAIRQAVAQQSSVTVSYVKLVDTKWLIKTSSGKIARAANRAKWLQTAKHH